MSGRHGGISQNPEVGIPAGLPEGLALCPGFWAPPRLSVGLPRRFLLQRFLFLFLLQLLCRRR